MKIKQHAIILAMLAMIVLPAACTKPEGTGPDGTQNENNLLNGIFLSQVFFSGSDWKGGLDPGLTFVDGRGTLTVPHVGGQEWMGQVKLVARVPVYADKQYDFSCKLKSSGNGVCTIKLADAEDDPNHEFFYDPNVSLTAGNELSYKKSSTSPDRNYQTVMVIFDFGRMTPGTQIIFSDLVLIDLSETSSSTPSGNNGQETNTPLKPITNFSFWSSGIWETPLSFSYDATGKLTGIVGTTVRAGITYSSSKIVVDAVYSGRQTEAVKKTFFLKDGRPSRATGEFKIDGTWTQYSSGSYSYDNEGMLSSWRYNYDDGEWIYEYMASFFWQNGNIMKHAFSEIIRGEPSGTDEWLYEYGSEDNTVGSFALGRTSAWDEDIMELFNLDYYFCGVAPKKLPTKKYLSNGKLQYPFTYKFDQEGYPLRMDVDSNDIFLFSYDGKKPELEPEEEESNDDITGTVRATVSVSGPGYSYSSYAQSIDGNSTTLNWFCTSNLQQVFIYGGVYCNNPDANGGKGVVYPCEWGYNRVQVDADYTYDYSGHPVFYYVDLVFTLNKP